MAIELIAQQANAAGNTPIHGENNRLLTDSDISTRARIISKDTGLAFPVIYNAIGIETDEYIMVITNTSDLEMIIEDVGLNSEVATRLELHHVTLGAASGDAITVTNGNTAKPKSFSNFGTAFEAGATAGGVANVTLVGLADQAWVQATGHQEFRLNGVARIAQGKSVAIYCKEATGAGDIGGVVFVTFE